MSEMNSLYQADLVFDSLDGEMGGVEIKAFNFMELIEEIEKVQNTHIKVEVWSALFILIVMIFLSILNMELLINKLWRESML